MALRAVREDERDGYVQRLEAFADQHRERLEELLRAYGPGSAPAEHGRYALGRPARESDHLRTAGERPILDAMWEDELKDILLDDLAFAWCARHRPRR